MKIRFLCGKYFTTPSISEQKFTLQAISGLQNIFEYQKHCIFDFNCILNFLFHHCIQNILHKRVLLLDYYFLRTFIGSSIHILERHQLFLSSGEERPTDSLKEQEDGNCVEGEKEGRGGEGERERRGE